MDEADLAQESIDFHLAHKLRQVQWGMNSPLPPFAKGGELCEGCGEEIPDARRKAVPGCTRCVSCQTEAEREKK